MKAIFEGGTNNDQVLEIGALVPQVEVRAYAFSALAREIKPGDVERETYRNANRTRAAGAFGVLPVYTLVGTTFAPKPMSRGQANELARKAGTLPVTVIAGDEVKPQ
jgi:hypothetical protein